MDETSVFLLLCLAGVGACATLILVAWYFDRRRGNLYRRLRAVGLTPETGTWEALRYRDRLAGVYRGRHLTMSHESDASYENPRVFTRVRVALESASGTRLTIAPKWPPTGLGGWLDELVAPNTDRFEDSFSISSDPPDLAARALALPGIAAILRSHPKPAMEFKGCELRLDRPGYFPDPQDAIRLFDALCDLAELIEQPARTPGAG